MRLTPFEKGFGRNEILGSRPDVHPAGVLGIAGAVSLLGFPPALYPPMIPFVFSQPTVSKSIIWYHLVSSELGWGGGGGNCLKLKRLFGSEWSFDLQRHLGASGLPVKTGKIR